MVYYESRVFVAVKMEIRKTMAGFAFPGINLALATPFDAQGKIDFGRLEQNIEKFIKAGIKSILVSSGTGIHVYLSQKESQELIERACKIIKGRTKVIAQTSALVVDEVVERTAHAATCGADGVMVLPPFFEGPKDDDGIVAFYEAVAAVGLPVIGYNVPTAVGVTITPDLLRKLAAIPKFCSLKDSSGDFPGHLNLIQTGHDVMNGVDSCTLYALYAGCKGLIWGGANIAPRTCLAMVAAAEAGNWDKARDIWRALEPIMSFIEETDYVATVYAAADIMGYGAGVPRKPLSSLAPERLARLRPILETLAKTENAKA
jgi:4-hydroxy-tetrahydrodipicolinate synthase